jgi:seryl-tRNA synthetase
MLEERITGLVPRLERSLGPPTLPVASVSVIDLRRLRDDATYLSGALRKGADPALVDELLRVAEAQRSLQTEVEALRAQQNAASKEIGRAVPEERQSKIDAAARLKAELQHTEASLAEASESLDQMALQIPNPADERCPDGGEDDYEVVTTHGDTGEAPPLDHAGYAAKMGWVETEKAAQNMGSRFAYLQREAVMLEFTRWPSSCLEGSYRLWLRCSSARR